MPTTYLGLPLGSLSKARGTWYHIIEKVEPHFVGLKKMYLSKGERITFIKSTLSSHSIDFICFFFLISKKKYIKRTSRKQEANERVQRGTQTKRKHKRKQKQKKQKRTKYSEEN